MSSVSKFNINGNDVNLINDDIDFASLDSSNIDLDIIDSSGNILCYLKNGHIKTKNFDSEEIINDLQVNEAKTNHWYNKKWFLLGTSVAFGSNSSIDVNPLDPNKKGHAYTQEAAKMLDVSVICGAVPGLATEIYSVTYKDADGKVYETFAPHLYGSTTMSKTEYTAWNTIYDKFISKDYIVTASSHPSFSGYQSKYSTESDISYYFVKENLGKVVIPDSQTVTSWVPDGSYSNYYRCYENIFTEENKDVDLWIFSIGPNNSTGFNTDSFDNFDFSNWQWVDSTSFESHRTSLFGSLIFLLNQMYYLNPYARCLLVIDSAFNYSNVKDVFLKMPLPLIDLYTEQIGTKFRNYYFKSKAGTDSHPTGYAQMLMGQILANKILSIN